MGPWQNALSIRPKRSRSCTGSSTRTSQTEHFRARCQIFLAVASNPDFLLARLAEPVSYQGFTAGPAPQPPSPGAKTFFADAAKRELLAVPYHAAETALRLYLAHRGLPVSPWAVLARRDMQGFRAAVRRIADGHFSDLPHETGREVLSLVFKGRRKPSDLPPEFVPRWDASLDRIEDWLSRLAGFWLENSAYNSFKHGLVFFATELGLRLDDGSVISREGEAIRYLEEMHDHKGHGKNDGKLRLYETHSWLSVPEAVLLTEAATFLIDALISTARARYLNEVPFDVPFLDHLTPSYEVSDALGATGIVLNHVRMSLVELVPAKP